MIGEKREKIALTATGAWGFFVVVAMVFSFRAEYRLPVAGLLVHPYLLVLPVAVILSWTNFVALPDRVMFPMISFFVFFSVASLQNDSPQSEIFKVAASLATFVFFAAAIRSEKDFTWISWALLLCALSIGVQGFLLAEETDSIGMRLAGINVLDGIGNKNAQSLFTLPGLYFGSFLLVQAISERRVMKIAILVAFLFIIITSVFLSANRSGWVGLAIIFVAVIFVIGIKGRTIFFSLIVVLLSYYAVDQFASDIFSRKKSQTIEGYRSDVGRRMLMVESMVIGLENPLFGVGIDELHHQMASRLNLNRYGVQKMDTHFLPGYLFGATGIISFSLFFLFLGRLAGKGPLIINQNSAVRRGRLMVMFFVILFITRSFFSREILYSPTFVSGLGIIFGYYTLTLRRAYSLIRG
jgi:hypothetical protein